MYSLGIYPQCVGERSSLLAYARTMFERYRGKNDVMSRATTVTATLLKREAIGFLSSE